MKTFLLLLSALGGVSSLYGDEFFINYVTKFVNHSTSPCDNFYRHVCPRNINYNDGLISNAFKTAREWIDEGARKLEQSRNYTLFEKILISIQSGREKRSADVNLHAKANMDLVRSGDEVKNLYWSMLERMQYLSAIPDIHMFAPRRLMHEIIQMAEKEIEVSSDLYTDLTKERLRETLATLNTERYDEYAPSIYGEIFDNLDVFFKATGALDGFNESNVNAALEDFLQVLGKYASGLLNLRPLAPTLDLLPERINGMNAYYNWDNSLFFYDTVLIMSIGASLSPVKYGSAGIIMAHEMFHSILDSIQWTNDVKLGQHSVCLASHMENVCKVFNEGDCVSGAVTYDEDGPDMEAIQLVYKLLRTKMDKELKTPVKGTNVTNEQMFFYANAVFHCQPADGATSHQRDETNPSGWDGHSSGIPRVNGVPSIMNAFHEAFNCKAGDRMFDIAVGREGCNAFGDPVRK